jgi:hypothetical protein
LGYSLPGAALAAQAFEMAVGVSMAKISPVGREGTLLIHESDRDSLSIA